MTIRLLIPMALLVSHVAAAQRGAPASRLLVSGDTVGATCSAAAAATVINQWFVAMSTGDTATIRRLARPALLVFSAGRNGLPEPAFRADSPDQLIGYVAERHRVRDHWSLLEVRSAGSRGQVLGFMPIARRTSTDPRATTGFWLGKAEYLCGNGVRVLNLAPWPAEMSPYRPPSG